MGDEHAGMIIGWKAVADFFGYEVNEVEAFKKRLYRLGLRLPKLKGNVYAFRSTLSLLKSRLHADIRKHA